jgi:hypothetical protein
MVALGLNTMGRAALCIEGMTRLGGSSSVLIMKGEIGDIMPRG